MADLTQKSFEQLVRDHHRRLLAYAISLVDDEHGAQDIVQNALVTAYVSVEKLDDVQAFGPWVRGIVRNKAHEWRRAQNLVGLESDYLEVVESQHRQWDELEAESGQSAMAALQGCLKKLSTGLAQAVDLFYMHRLSGRDVASKLGEEESTVRKRLQRARTQLGDCITHTLEAQNA